MPRKRRKRRIVRQVVEEPEELEELLDEDEDEEDYEEEEEVEEKPAPVKTRRRRKVAKEEDEEEDEDEEPAPVRRTRRKKVEEPVVEIRSVDATITDNVFTQVMEALDEGKSIVITRLSAKKWNLATAESVISATTKLSGQEFWREVLTPEFKKHESEWGELTFAEKKKLAKKAGVTWESHKDSRVEVMRLTAAYRKQSGMVKYKEQYASRKARADIRA